MCASSVSSCVNACNDLNFVSVLYESFFCTNMVIEISIPVCGTSDINTVTNTLDRQRVT